MPPKTFNVAAECFGDPDGPCSLAVAKKAGIQFAPTSDDSDIVPLVVSGSPPAPAKVKTVCSHSVSKTAAKHLGALTIFYAPPAALQAKLKAELLDLNPPAETTSEYPLARLNAVCPRHVGGILLVVKHWDNQKAGYSEPILQVVANPAVASLGALDNASAPPGMISEVWDLTASSPLDQLPVSDSTCPLMVSTGGYSRKLKPTIANYLKSTGPLFILSGEKVAGVVNVIPAHHVNRAMFLPAVCDPPFGMFWNLEGLKLKALIDSIKALSSAAISPYANFLLTLEQFSPRLDAWLQQAAGRPDQFACEAFYYADLADQFPCLTTGAVPSSVSCAITLSPLLDMRYLYAWRLLLDSLLSNSKAKDDIPFIRVFLERAVACMTSDTYLGVVLPPELTPNLAFHFYILHGLPSNAVNPFTDFMRSELVSTIAQTYAQIPIQVHPDQSAPADDVKLMTASAQSALKHREKTPRHSNVPVDRLLPPSGTSGATLQVVESPLRASNPFQGTPANVPASSGLARSGPRQRPVEPPVTPSGTNLFGGLRVYSPPFHHSSSRQPAPPPGAPAQQVLFPTPPIVKPKWEEIASWTLFSLANCAPEYLSLCFPSCAVTSCSTSSMRSIALSIGPATKGSLLGIPASTAVLARCFLYFTTELSVSSIVSDFIFKVLSTVLGLGLSVRSTLNLFSKQGFSRTFYNLRPGAWKLPTTRPIVMHRCFMYVTLFQPFQRTQPPQPSCQSRVLRASR
jgi:hypothetical protein